MIIRTLYSAYEVNYPDMLIRRVQGVHPTTSRLSPQGEWKRFVCLLSLMDHSMMIFWNEYGGQATLTSPVVEVGK